MSKSEQAAKAVNDINLSESYNRLGELNYDKLALLEYRTDGNIDWITFLGETIWDSDNDERKFDDDENDWEPLEPYIRKLMIKKLEMLNEQLKCLKGTIQCHCETDNLFEITVFDCKDCGKTHLP